MQNTLNDHIKEAVEDIYIKIYKGFYEENLIIFLCGGASHKQRKSLRDKLKPLLEKNRKYKMPISVFYPEDLLIEALNKSKNDDLLSYERFLADNSHIIVIICESPGALVELGAFVNNEYTVNKVIAAVDKRHVKEKSFIMLGPIKYLKKIGNNNVVEYGENIDDTFQTLLKSIHERTKKKLINHKLNIDTIVGMHYYIQLLLYFFKELNSLDLSSIIKYTIDKYKIPVTKFDLIFQAALKLLFYENFIIRTQAEKVTTYQLTDKGYNEITKIIDRCTNSYQCDKIRVGIMYSKYYRTPRS